MKNIIYLFQFIFISLFFLIFKFLRLKLSSAIGGKLFQIVGPIFRSNKLIRENIKKALPQLNNEEIKKINKQMWSNYGRIFYTKWYHSRNLLSFVCGHVCLVSCGSWCLFPCVVCFSEKSIH